jgi:hypothetical protein
MKLNTKARRLIVGAVAMASVALYATPPANAATTSSWCGDHAVGQRVVAGAAGWVWEIDLYTEASWNETVGSGFVVIRHYDGNNHWTTYWQRDAYGSRQVFHGSYDGLGFHPAAGSYVKQQRTVYTLGVARHVDCYTDVRAG